MDRFSQQLQAEGLLAREGSIVDAKSKLIDGYTTTPASVHDSKVLEDLVDERPPKRPTGLMSA